MGNSPTFKPTHLCARGSYTGIGEGRVLLDAMVGDGNCNSKLFCLVKATRTGYMHPLDSGSLFKRRTNMRP